MVKKIRTGLIYLFLSISASCLLAQEERPGEIALAYEILEERGEIILDIQPENSTDLEKLSKWVSMARKLSDGYRIYANREGFSKIIEHGISFRVIDVRKKEPYKKSSAVFPGDWDTYPSHTDYIKMMQDFAKNYPAICRLETIGQSVDGRDILVIKITDQPDIREPEPAFYYTSTMHGDEPSGYIHLLRLIDHILSNYEKDPLISRLVENIEIWINPLANPDGAYWNGDEELNQPKRLNQNNIDLNRDFPDIVYDKDPDISDYQPENQAQMEFMEGIHLVLSANIHDGEELVNYPWDSWEKYHADDAWFQWASRKYADTAQLRAVPVKYMTSYDNGIVLGWKWYITAGSRQDYSVYFLHAKEVTLELSMEPHPPPDELPFFWYYNYPSLLLYMENCLFGIQGVVTDAVSGDPVDAMVWVEDHEEDESYAVADKATGYFARLIEPGTWDLVVVSDGYDTQIIQDVTVQQDKATPVNIQLTPSNIGMSAEVHLNISPNPFIYNALLSYHVKVPGRHQIRLIDLNGRLVLEDLRIYMEPGEYSYRLDGEGLQEGIYILQFLSPESTITRKIFKSQ